MVFRTRLFNFIFRCNQALLGYTNHRPRVKAQPSFSDQKDQWSIDKLTRVLCFLLIGFLVGNLFGTFLNTIRRYITWDGGIVFFLITLIEIFNYNVYHNEKRPFFFFLLNPKIVKRSFWKSFHFLKIGLMVGFFVDAFKVGS